MFELIAIVFVVALYLLPTLLGALNERRAVVPIAVVNILLGWTIIGWFVALFWALAPARQSSSTNTTSSSGARSR